MPTQNELRPEIADQLAALARAKGISVDDLLQQVLRDMGPPRDALAERSLEEFEQDMDALAEGLEHFLVDYQGTYSREDIYLDHD